MAVQADDAEIQEAFNYFDRDRDGKISTSELGHLMRSLGRAPTEAEVQEYIKSDADPNGNGFFDLEGLKEVCPCEGPHGLCFGFSFECDSCCWELGHEKVI